MVPATALPEAGIAPVTAAVTYRVLPEPVAKMVLLGEAELPIVPKAESDRVQPLAFDPDTMYVPLPLTYIRGLVVITGDPELILKRLLETYPVIATFEPATNPVKELNWCSESSRQLSPEYLDW
jgi:hypothetical protein